MNSTPQAPDILQIPISKFDPSPLPDNARQPGTDAFEQAVLTHYALLYAGKGWSAAVTIDEHYIRVLAVPEQGIAPKDYVVGLLQHGFLEDALPMLEALYAMLDDPDIAYNYGICLSELGRIDDCFAPLERCLALDPQYAKAAVGLGFAYARKGDNDAAEQALRKALSLEPGEVHALRNLAAILGRQGRLDEALPLFREAVARAPSDPQAVYNLAMCLEDLGGAHRSEAKTLYKSLIEQYPDSPIYDAAVARANELSNQDLHGAVDGKPRPDAVMYMQGAMDLFGELPRKQVGEVVMEIAKLGESGLAINDPNRRYTLKSLPGNDYSGLHLMCMMHVGFRLFDPATDPGTGLQREYELAKGMSSSQQ